MPTLPPSNCAQQSAVRLVVAGVGLVTPALTRLLMNLKVLTFCGLLSAHWPLELTKPPPLPSSQMRASACASSLPRGMHAGVGTPAFFRLCASRWYWAHVVGAVPMPAFENRRW